MTVPETENGHSEQSHGLSMGRGVELALGRHPDRDVRTPRGEGARSTWNSGAAFTWPLTGELCPAGTSR